MVIFGGRSNMFKLFFVLLIVHAILDFPLQGDVVAINKNPNAKTELQKNVPWYYWMAAHALAHGGGVLFITGSFLLSILETLAHFLIDFGKCHYKYSIHVDQALHIASKVLWVLIAIFYLN
jgi:hypothetical protein